MNQRMPSFVARDYLKQLRSQVNITPSFILHDGTTAGDFALAYLRQKDQASSSRKKDVDVNNAIKKSAKRKQTSSKHNHESKKSNNGSATTKTNLHHTTKDAV
jgi:hypothetical protein